MTHLPQDPTHGDIDTWLDETGPRLILGTERREHLLVQLDITVVRRYVHKLRRRLRDMDLEILDLKDQLVSVGGER